MLTAFELLPRRGIAGIEVDGEAETAATPDPVPVAAAAAGVWVPGLLFLHHSATTPFAAASSAVRPAE